MASSRGYDLFYQETPDVPFFTIKLEDRIYDMDINFLENFTLEKRANDYGTFTFSMVNVADLHLENKFFALFDKYKDCPPISIQYGWVKSGKSPWYRGTIFNFTPKWRSGGYVDIEVSGELNSLEAELQAIKSYKGERISDIVAAIANDYGWIIEEIEQTKSLGRVEPFTIDNTDPISYIRDELLKYAVNSKNESMVFYTELGDAGETHIWFVSMFKSIAVQKNYNFFINMGNYGNVLSWSANYEGNKLGGAMELASLDMDTNDFYVYGKEDERLKQKSGSQLTVYGATTPERMQALLNNKWNQANIGAMKGQLEIIGDPTINIQQRVNVCPMTPDGNFHAFLGGTFIVSSLVDTIAQSYTTNMELTRADDGGGRMPLAETVQLKGKQ